MQPRRIPAASRQAGFTLLEMIVVLVIIGLIMGLVGPRLFGQADKAKVQTALKQVLQALATAGHESLAVDIAVHGRCADCAHPAGGAAA